MVFKYILKSLQDYPFIYSLFIGCGIGWGFKAGIQKLVEKIGENYIVLINNQSNIQKILLLHKKETISFFEKIENYLTQILEKLEERGD